MLATLEADLQATYAARDFSRLIGETERLNMSELAPIEFATAQLYRGMAFRATGEYARAHACLQAALRDAEENGFTDLQARCLVALVAVAAGAPDPVEAARLASRFHSLAKSGSSYEKWAGPMAYNLGVAHEWAGNLEEALVAYQEAIKSGVAQAQLLAKINSVGVLVAQGRSEEALARATEIEAESGPDPLLPALTAQALIDLGRIGEAVDLLRTVPAGTGEEVVQAEIQASWAALHVVEGQAQLAREAAYEAIALGYRAIPAAHSAIRRALTVLTALR